MGQGLHHGIGHVDAGDFGFRPGANGLDNSRALQQALDRGGTVTVHESGVYEKRRDLMVDGLRRIG